MLLTYVHGQASGFGATVGHVEQTGTQDASLFVMGLIMLFMAIIIIACWPEE